MNGRLISCSRAPASAAQIKSCVCVEIVGEKGEGDFSFLLIFDVIDLLMEQRCVPPTSLSHSVTRMLVMPKRNERKKTEANLGCVGYVLACTGQ